MIWSSIRQNLGSLDETLAQCHLFKPGPARAEEARDDEKWEKSDQGGGEATQPPVVLFNRRV